jgi:hypothetical protein
MVGCQIEFNNLYFDHMKFHFHQIEADFKIDIFENLSGTFCVVQQKLNV